MLREKSGEISLYLIEEARRELSLQLSLSLMRAGEQMAPFHNLLETYFKIVERGHNDDLVLKEKAFKESASSD